jgi:hypothetical protein
MQKLGLDDQYFYIASGVFFQPNFLRPAYAVVSRATGKIVLSISSALTPVHTIFAIGYVIEVDQPDRSADDSRSSQPDPSAGGMAGPRPDASDRGAVLGKICEMRGQWFDSSDASKYWYRVKG